MFWALLIITVHSDIELYRFADNYVEFWYQISINPAAEEQTVQDSVFKEYTYRLEIHNTQCSDSGVIDGEKGAFLFPSLDQNEVYFIDYIPVYLYPGIFEYKLKIEFEDYSVVYEDSFKLLTDSGQIYTSDLVVGKKCRGEIFKFHNFPFMPVINHGFQTNDTLFSYLEIYGLEADSLCYHTHYAILSNNGTPIHKKDARHLKSDYIIIDTASFYLGALVDGEYTFVVEVDDSVSRSTFSYQKPFFIKPFVADISKMQFCAEIQYLVSMKEYKKFKELSEQEQRIYLKKFWTEHNYQEFEQRLLEADEKFSTRVLKGRDSHRGKYFIKHGPPESIDDIPMNEWGRPLELWHYYTKGKDVLFCDTHEDGNPRLIAALRVNELFHILELGYYTPEDLRKWPWLSQIVPGTYFGQKNMMDMEDKLLPREP